MTRQIPLEWLFPPTLEEAAKVQRHLAGQVITTDHVSDVRWLAGVDVSNNLYDQTHQVYACWIVLNYPSLQVKESACAKQQAKLPYVPGFLAFREVPALVEAFEKLPQKPDLVLVDGHGISHPRGLGIASHLGVVLDRPTIGVAKSILVGKPQGELGPEAGDHIPLVWRNQTIGAVLRTKAKTNPVYVSTGHKVSLDSAITWVVNSLTRYRLPEPTRLAHQSANTFRKQMMHHPV